MLAQLIQTMIIKTDYRKSNAFLVVGLIFLSLLYFTLQPESHSTKIFWSTFSVVISMIFLSAALLSRDIIQLSKDSLIIKNRLGIFTKRILFEDIKKSKLTDKEFPIGAYNNSILHLLLWDKKFNRFKFIELYDCMNKKIFTIDGQTVDNVDFGKLWKLLKR